MESSETPVYGEQEQSADAGVVRVILTIFGYLCSTVSAT
jgi:hypothetical protein